MAKMTLTEMTAILEAAVAKGSIYNVEMTDLKFTMGNLIWRDEAVQTARRNVKKLFEPRRHELKVYDAVCYISMSTAHDLLNAVNAINRATAKAGNADDAAIVAFFETAKGYIHAAEMIKSLKDKVIKGRVPSENPNLNARTIENTGTCGCCSKNVKLTNAGRIWDHGFQVLHRGFGAGVGFKAGGSCFGVGYEPIEISKQVWVDMLAGWEERLPKLPGYLQTAQEEFAAMAPAFRRAFNEPALTEEQKQHNRSRQLTEQAIMELRHELERLPLTIEEMKDKLAAWKPRPLPGTAR